MSLMPPLTRAARIEGCLLGGAIGDALGAPYEGLHAEHIPLEPLARGEYGEPLGGPPRREVERRGTAPIPGWGSRRRPVICFVTWVAVA